MSRAHHCTGHSGEDSPIRIALIHRYCEAELLASYALRAVEQLGLHGRGNRAFAKYLRLVDRQLKLAKLIGLGRATKPPNVAEQFAAMYAGGDAA
jgi:hypothetical protein